MLARTRIGGLTRETRRRSAQPHRPRVPPALPLRFRHRSLRPDRRTVPVTDQFLLGDGLMVAPVVTKGADGREVLIPPGTWLADDGRSYVGPAHVWIDAPLARLPYLRKSCRPEQPIKTL
ncbi:hypothetical protein ACGFYQ_07600 [Streptomyces sp. NPDC048258]|uniref:hypothetical protein n=1 Tax=Streptomyces sp. NPDC048258 TaxID=3365527 RepID=UPI0037199F24